MSPYTPMHLTFLIAVFLGLFSSALAAPQGLLQLIPNLIGKQLNILNFLPIGNAPVALKTKNPSPVCHDVNQGALLCCQNILDGNLPLVYKLSEATGYELTANTINGLYCKKSIETATCDKIPVCCEADAAATGPLEDVISLAMWCQHAPR